MSLGRFDYTTLTQDERPYALWVSALLAALARDEVKGRRRPRLTEAKRATWERFRGRLSDADLMKLLFEDAAVIHPVPFDLKALGTELQEKNLPVNVLTQWLNSLQDLSAEFPSIDYIQQQAKLLGLPTRLAYSDLHVVKPHYKVLELPGTGGQLAHRLLTQQPELSLQDNFVIACHTWQEKTLAGIVGLELSVPHSDFIVASDLDAMRNSLSRNFDMVIGLSPDKGGLYTAENQLSVWFPQSKLILV